MHSSPWAWALGNIQTRPQFSKLMFCQILEIPDTISQSFFFRLTLWLVIIIMTYILFSIFLTFFKKKGGR